MLLMSKRRLWLIRSLLVLVGFIFLVLAIEVGGRFYIHLRYGQPQKTYGLWEYDETLGARHRKNAYNTLTSLNNWGFRNQEDVVEPQPGNGLRIMSFGGSTTFHYNLKDHETYPFLLEQRLRAIEGFEQTQVLNVGRITYSAGHNWIVMNRLIPKLKPDYAILYDGPNEILNAFALVQDGVSLDDLMKQGQFGAIGMSQDQNHWLKRHSVFARLLTRITSYPIRKRLSESQAHKQKSARQIQDISMHPWVLENFKTMMNQMIDFLKHHEVTPIVILYAYSTGEEMHATFVNAISELAAENNVLIYDMKTDFKSSGIPMSELFIASGIHVTAQGADLMAHGLYRLIEANEKKKRIQNHDATHIGYHTDL